MDELETALLIVTGIAVAGLTVAVLGLLRRVTDLRLVLSGHSDAPRSQLRLVAGRELPALAGDALDGDALLVFARRSGPRSAFAPCRRCHRDRSGHHPRLRPVRAPPSARRRQRRAGRSGSAPVVPGACRGGAAERVLRLQPVHVLQRLDLLPQRLPRRLLRLPVRRPVLDHVRVCGSTLYRFRCCDWAYGTSGRCICRARLGLC
jgi:hypothetical protein